MSEELALSFTEISSADQVISIADGTIAKDETSISYQESFKVGQTVQFMKATLHKNGKISFKETFGIITCISDGYIEIKDYLGDVVRSTLSNIKSPDGPIFMYTDVEFLDVV